MSASAPNFTRASCQPFGFRYGVEGSQAAAWRACEWHAGGWRWMGRTGKGRW
jgi:hypothetical protein